MNRKWLPLAAVAAVTALVAGGAYLDLSATRAAAPPRPKAIAPTPRTDAPPGKSAYANPPDKFLGVSLPDGPAGLPRFNGATHTRPDLLEVFTGWGQPFPEAQVDSSYRGNVLTLVSWEPTGDLKGVAAGKDDGYLRSFARAAAGVPVMIDFAHEFNGDWYPWGTQAVTPAQFVAAWRHVRDLFAADPNVIWVWSPNVINPVPDVDLASYWPGDKYVDIVGIVGYWTGSLGEDSWATLITPTEKKIRAFTADPFIITETGAQQGTRKASWVAAMIEGFETDPDVIGLVYFDFGTKQGKRADWTLEDDPAAVKAWTSGLEKYPSGP